MNKEEKFIISFIYIMALFGYFIMSLSFLPIQEVEGRCPNGYHKSQDGDCEKVSKFSNARSTNDDDNDDDDDDKDNKIDFTKTKKREK